LEVIYGRHSFCVMVKIFSYWSDQCVKKDSNIIAMLFRTLNLQKAQLLRLFHTDGSTRC